MAISRAEIDSAGSQLPPTGEVSTQPTPAETHLIRPEETEIFPGDESILSRIFREAGGGTTEGPEQPYSFTQTTETDPNVAYPARFTEEHRWGES